MATHYRIFAWRIPGQEEPGTLQSMASQSQTLVSDECCHFNTLAKLTQKMTGFEVCFLFVDKFDQYHASVIRTALW